MNRLFIFSLLVAVSQASYIPPVVSSTGTGTVAVLQTSPGLLGAPTAPTPSASDNSTTIPTTAYVTTGIANAIAAVNPAVAVQAATAAVLPNAPNYNNGVSGVGATLTSTTMTALVVDGYTVLLNDRILVKNQASALQNGVYTMTTLGTGAVFWILTRALDFDQPSDINNSGLIPVNNNGTVNAKTGWFVTSTVNTVGTDAVNFTQFAVNSANIVTAVAPGVGLCHFAGATQTCTSSAVNLASADVTGITPLANGGTNSSGPFVTNPQTGTYQVLAADFTNFKTITVASGTFTITLVASGTQPVAGTWIKIINYGSGVVTIARSGQNINGGTASVTLESSSATIPTEAFVLSDGTNYFISSGFTNPMTTAGDVIIGGTTGLPTRTACTAGFLKGGAPPACTAIASADLPAALGSQTSINGVTIPTAAGNATATQVIATGTSALGTGAIGSGACAAAVTTTATGTLTTDDFMADFNADPTGVVGYQPSANGMLTIIKYPTANNVNFKVCNNTSASITPGAITLNWRVVR